MTSSATPISLLATNVATIEFHPGKAAPEALRAAVKARGSSAEFAEHRPYFPGDDVRRIDWNAYARLEELVRFSGESG